jgi:hypothetical protein
MGFGLIKILKQKKHLSGEELRCQAKDSARPETIPLATVLMTKPRA